ncbi:MAG: hypothetical protein ACREQA_20765 [Candidatus Binatia bacterium]
MNIKTVGRFVIPAGIGIALAFSVYYGASYTVKQMNKAYEANHSGKVRTSADNVAVWHDDSREVTCWIIQVYRGAGISCLPDGEVRVR